MTHYFYRNINLYLDKSQITENLNFDCLFPSESKIGKIYVTNNEYINNYRFGFAEDLRTKIYSSGIEKLHFAYAGEINSSKGFYYRIQGGDLLIEYDNIQNNANHVHTVVRDLSNDWAESILKNHYKGQHKID